MRLSLGALLPLLGVAAIACDDPLKPAEQVDSLRVLAARVEVEGDPERAAPNAGESASVRWLVAAPEGEPALGWALSVCFARPNNVGLSGCAEPPFASALTCSTVAIVVSPGKVVSSAPCAQPSFTASSSEAPLSRP